MFISHELDDRVIQPGQSFLSTNCKNTRQTGQPLTSQTIYLTCVKMSQRFMLSDSLNCLSDSILIKIEMWSWETQKWCSSLCM